MSKNWPNDARVGCKAPNNLIDLINFESNLKFELDEFESSFEQDELKEDQLNSFCLVYLWNVIKHFCLYIRAF
jgi:hypothetical protein